MLLRVLVTLGWVNAYAQGTNYSKAGVALVGEKGPELLNLQAGSQILPNDKLSGLLGGTAGVVSSLTQAITSGLSGINSSIRQASMQPVQITKISNVFIDSMSLSSEAEGTAFADQLRYMG